MELQTILIIALAAALVLAAIGAFAIQWQQLQKFRTENEKLRREIATLQQDVTHYQSLVSAVQFAPAMRIEPVFRHDRLLPDATTNTEAGSPLKQRTGEAGASDSPSTALLSSPRRAASKHTKRRVPYPVALLIAQAATIVIGALVMVVAAFGIFYLLSHDRLIY